MKPGKPEHFKEICNWCIQAVDSWGINAMGYWLLSPLVVLPWLGYNPPGWLKYGLVLMGFLLSHPPPGG